MGFESNTYWATIACNFSHNKESVIIRNFFISIFTSSFLCVHASGNVNQFEAPPSTQQNDHTLKGGGDTVTRSHSCPTLPVLFATYFRT